MCSWICGIVDSDVFTVLKRGSDRIDRKMRGVQGSWDSIRRVVTWWREGGGGEMEAGGKILGVNG
jgi:hypothetical protein